MLVFLFQTLHLDWSTHFNLLSELEKPVSLFTDSIYEWVSVWHSSTFLTRTSGLGDYGSVSTIDTLLGVICGS